MKRFIIILLLILSITIPIVRADNLIVDNFENISAWTTDSGSGDTITISSDTIHITEGNKSLKINYTLNSTNDDWVLVKKSFVHNLSDYGQMNVSIYADDSKNFLRFRFRTDSNNVYNLYYYLNNSEWNNISLSLSSATLDAYSSWNNIASVEIMIDDRYDSNQGSGIIYIDNWTMIPKGTPIALRERFSGIYYPWFGLPNDGIPDYTKTYRYDFNIWFPIDMVNGYYHWINNGYMDGRPRNEDNAAGFWLIRADNTKTPIFNYLKNIIDTNSSYADKIGSSHWAPFTYFTNDCVLKEGGDRLTNEMGSSVIRIGLDSLNILSYHMADFVFNCQYSFNGTWSISTLDSLKSKDYQDLFNNPNMKTIIFESGGLTDIDTHYQLCCGDDYTLVEKAIYNDTKYLLQTYQGTNKTFIFETSGDIHPNTSNETSNFLAWINARQDGIIRARNEIGENDVRVMGAMETTNFSEHINIIPYIYADLYGLNAYEQEGSPEQLTGYMNYIANISHDDTRYGFGNKNIYIAEIGCGENWPPDEDPWTGQKCVDNLISPTSTITTALNWGVQYLIYWQLYGQTYNGNPVNPPAVIKNPPNDITANYYPLEGVYSSVDINFVNQTLKLINESGLEILTYEWWEGDPYAGIYSPLDIIFNNSGAYNIKVILRYDAQSPSASPDNLRKRIINYIDRYGDNPSLYRDSEYGNRPIVAINGTNIFSSWQAYLDNISILRGTKYDVILLSYGSSNINTFDRLTGFDGKAVYAINNTDNIQSDIDWTKSHKKMYRGGLSPGFYSERNRNGSSLIINRNNGTFYENFFNDIVYNKKLERFDIASINDWQSGNQILPTDIDKISSNDSYMYLNFTPFTPTWYIDKTHQMISNYTGTGYTPLFQNYSNNKTNNFTVRITVNESEPILFKIMSDRLSDIRWYENNSLKIINTSVLADTWSYYNISWNGFDQDMVRTVQVTGTNNNGTTSTMYWTINIKNTILPFILRVYNTGWQTIFVNDTMTFKQIANIMNNTNVKFITDWNETTQTFNTYWPTIPYRENQNINKGQAVWIKFTNNDTMTRNTSSGSFNRTLKIGWNMLGNSYNGARTLSQINTSINNGKTCDDGVDQIIYTNLSTQQDYKYNCGDSINENIQVLQGEGFWAHSNNDYDIERIW